MASDGKRSASTSQDEGEESSPKTEDEILAPKPVSPTAPRTSTLERAVRSTSTTLRTPVTRGGPATQTTPRTAASTAASREIEDLKTKLKVLEKQRQDDRDKVKQLETVQGERDKYQDIIQKLQQKYAPQQQENSELRKQLKEAESMFSSIEDIQAEHDSALELATLDREMAEEQYEVAKIELEAIKQKANELELEVEILREENAEFTNGLSPEDRASVGFLQLERENGRLRDALIRLRDITESQEEELKDQITSLEEDVKDFGTLKDTHAVVQEKLEKSESAVEDLRTQLDTALGAEDMIEDLTERNMTLNEQLEELKAVIEDLESLKEISDELEVNHVQNEREMQDDLDFKDAVIQEQARQAVAQQDNMDDMEYTLSRFRELVTNLQGDLEDLKASQAVTEGESEKLNDRSRAMMDLNMKLQISASKAQVKTIDLELRRLEAQEAEQHLEIVKLFLPESYQEDKDSVLALLRFRRLAFKANLLNGFLREKTTAQAHPGHEDDVFAACDAIDKLVWVSAMCDRFVHDISRCSIQQFSNYQNALLELEPVERALNSWIDALRRDDLKEKQCADELHRSMALMSHLAEIHTTNDLPNFADCVHMDSLIVQSNLDSAAVTFNTLKAMAQRVIPTEADNISEMAQHFFDRCDQVITMTRSQKVNAGRNVRDLEDLKTRSLTLPTTTKGIFEQCGAATQELADLARQIGISVHKLFTSDEGRAEPFTYEEVQDAIHKAVLDVTKSSESDLFSAYLSKLRVAETQLKEIAALSNSLDQTQEFDVGAAPWRLRSQELKALKTVPIDAEEEIRRLKDEYNEARRTIAQRDEHISTAVLKIDTLESRMKDAQANIERIAGLQADIEQAGKHIDLLKEDIEKQDRELKTLEADRDKWKSVASESRMHAASSDADGVKAGQERAVATAREMDALKQEIDGLQSAVRYLREDNRRARLTEQAKHDWLSEPLKKQTSLVAQRKALVLSEGKDVLAELLNMANSASLFNYASLPKDRLAWKPAKSTPQHRAITYANDHAAWKQWEKSVMKRSELVMGRNNLDSRKPTIRNPAAKLQIRLPGEDGKMVKGLGDGSGNVQVVGSKEWDAIQGNTDVV